MNKCLVNSVANSAQLDSTIENKITYFACMLSQHLGISWHKPLDTHLPPPITSLNCCEIFWAVVLTLTSFLHTEILRICFVCTVSCFPFKKVQAARILGVFHRFPLRFLLFQLLRVAASCSGSRRPSSACVAGTYDLSTAKHTALSQRTSRAAAFVAKLPCPSEEDQLNALGELGALNDNHAKSYCYPQALGVSFHMTSPPGKHFRKRVWLSKGVYPNPPMLNGWISILTALPSSWMLVVHPVNPTSGWEHLG